MNTFERVCGECRSVWLNTKHIPVTRYPRVVKSRQSANKKLLDTLYEEIREHFEKDDLCAVDHCMKKWLTQDAIWNLSWLQEDERESFYVISKQFMRDARSFDPELRLEDITQAIRNVWIILILEKIFDRPLHYHKAMFAYSMLYPYTDNLLDDETLKRSDKEQFNNWLSRRLKNETSSFEEESQRHVNELVSMIEDAYPRESHADVYASLLHIQDGQKRSLLQYDVDDDAVLLDISIAKGGASVLADGYLIDGTLNKEEYRFCIYFGFLLQIADDIQDLQQDRDHRYFTLVGILKEKKQRRSFCEKYFAYVHHVIRRLSPNQDKRVLNFIEDNCRLLIYFSLQQDAQWYPRIFLHHIRERLPLQAKDLKQLFTLMNTMEPFDIHKLDEYLQI